MFRISSWWKLVWPSCIFVQSFIDAARWLLGHETRESIFLKPFIDSEDRCFILKKLVFKNNSNSAQLQRKYSQELTFAIDKNV